MFGAPLPEALKQSSVAISLINQDGEQYVWGYVPAVVAKIGLFLKQHGTLCPRVRPRSHPATDVEGVFRINGSEKRMKELCTQFDTPPEYGKDIDWDGYKVHDAATLLRRFLNLMPEPVIPADRFVEFREVLAKPAVDEEEAIGAYRKLITSCPPATQYLLLYLLDLLAVFERNAEVNKMTANNLAILFQPGMLMHPSVRTKEDHQAAVRVVEFLITHQDRFVLDVSDLPPADMLPEELTRPKTKAALEKYLLVPSDSDEDLGDLEAHMGGGAMLARSAPNSRTMFQRKERRPRRERRRSSSQDVSPPAAAAPSPAAAPDRKDTTRTKPSVVRESRKEGRKRANSHSDAQAQSRSTSRHTTDAGPSNSPRAQPTSRASARGTPAPPSAIPRPPLVKRSASETGWSEASPALPPTARSPSRRSRNQSSSPTASPLLGAERNSASRSSFNGGSGSSLEGRTPRLGGMPTIHAESPDASPDALPDASPDALPEPVSLPAPAQPLVPATDDTPPTPPEKDVPRIPVAAVARPPALELRDDSASATASETAPPSGVSPLASESSSSSSARSPTDRTARMALPTPYPMDPRLAQLGPVVGAPAHPEAPAPVAAPAVPSSAPAPAPTPAPAADEAPLRAAAPIPYATTRAAVRPSSPPPAVLPPHSFDLHHAKVMYTISGPKHKS